jgi:hypothetical protein
MLQLQPEHLAGMLEQIPAVAVAVQIKLRPRAVQADLELLL